MKTILLFLLTATLPLCGLNAALLVYEGFNYTVPGTLTGQSGGTGFTAAWTGGGSGSTFNLSGTGLSSGSLQVTGGSILDNSGSTFSNARAYDVGGFQDNGDSLWFSTLVNIPTGSWTSPQKVFFLSNALDDSGIGFQINAGGTLVGKISGTTSTGSATLAQNTTHLIVGRIDFTSASAQTITYWVNPTLGSTPLDGAANFTLSASVSSANHRSGNIFVGSFSNTQGAFDEIRLGTSFSDVAPIPEPGTYALLGTGLALLALLRGLKPATRS